MFLFIIRSVYLTLDLLSFKSARLTVNLSAPHSKSSTENSKSSSRIICYDKCHNKSNVPNCKTITPQIVCCIKYAYCFHAVIWSAYWICTDWIHYVEVQCSESLIVQFRRLWRCDRALDGLRQAGLKPVGTNIVLVLEVTWQKLVWPRGYKPFLSLSTKLFSSFRWVRLWHSKHLIRNEV